jgi:hypothetical protein
MKLPIAINPNEQFYGVGNQACYRADGTIEFLKRADHLANIRGYGVEPGELEAQLLKHPLVKKTVAAVREGRNGVKRPVAYIVAEPDAIDCKALSELEVCRQGEHDYVPPPQSCRKKACGYLERGARHQAGWCYGQLFRLRWPSGGGRQVLSLGRVAFGIDLALRSWPEAPVVALLVEEALIGKLDELADDKAKFLMPDIQVEEVRRL